MRKYLAIALLSFWSHAAHPGEGWTGYKAIESLETYAGGTEIRLEGFNGSCTELTAEGGNTWARIGVNQANKEQLISVALMAFASGREINIYCGAGLWTDLEHIKVLR